MVGVENARWQDDDQLHITLRYIGEVDGRVAEDIALMLEGVAAPPPTIAVSGVGCFDKRGRTTALWAGVAPHPPLAHLHRKLDQALVRIGLAPERRAYLPHVTLARLNASSGSVATWLGDHGALAIAAFALDHFCLFESHLGSEGSHYEAVARYDFR